MTRVRARRYVRAMALGVAVGMLAPGIVQGMIAAVILVALDIHRFNEMPEAQYVDPPIYGGRRR